ncbi:MBL fold metallo-hydrolase [Mesorhizobium sp. M0040]|uniref:ComEC/Rec2 family competence protein n=1 Tax=Mesorhizobium sp. M0040 TaxID=2956855 RepID=UPI003336648C
MPDFLEIEFLDVETRKSGDAIAIRHYVNGQVTIQVVDGGYVDTGEKLAQHIRGNYGSGFIDHVLCTHNDGDHAGGLRLILEEFNVGALWMLRPWTYAAEIVHRFNRYSNADNLARVLKDEFSNLAALEEIAIRRGIPIFEPFQGAQVGIFRVLSPTKTRYLDLVVESEKSPAIKQTMTSGLGSLVETIGQVARAATNLVKRGWGYEIFSAEAVSAENRMSVVQFTRFANTTFLLTGDCNQDSLAEAAIYAPFAGLALPGVDKFQVPHHGSRRGLSTAILDQWLGPRLAQMPAVGQERFSAIISSAKADPDHPRKAVIRAMKHRGARVLTTEGGNVRTGYNAPDRADMGPATQEPYPDEIEE